MSVQISILTQKKAYYCGGEEVTGKVVLEVVGGPFKTRSVVIFLWGQTKAEITKLEVELELEFSHGLLVPVPKPKTKTYKHHVYFIKVYQRLLGVPWNNRNNSDAESFQLNVGTHQFDFSFRLPSSLPPSGFVSSGSDYASIRYSLEVNVHNSKLFSFNKEQELILQVAGYDMPRATFSSLISTPVPVSRCAEKTFLLSEGKLSALAKLPSKLLYKGDTTSLFININNNSQKTVEKVSFSLVLFSQIEVRGHKENEDESYSISTHLLRVLPNQKVSQQLDITLPSVRNSTTSRSPLTINAYIKVEIHIIGKLTKNLVFQLPVLYFAKPPAGYISSSTTAVTSKSPAPAQAKPKSAVTPQAAKTKAVPKAPAGKKTAAVTKVTATVAPTTATATAKAAPAPTITKGTHKFQNGDVYEGSLMNGATPHGEGELTYANGNTFRGKWHQGVIIDGSFIFSPIAEDYLEADEGMMETSTNDAQLDDIRITRPEFQRLVEYRKRVEAKAEAKRNEGVACASTKIENNDQAFRLLEEAGNDHMQSNSSSSFNKFRDSLSLALEEWIEKLVAGEDKSGLIRLVQLIQQNYGTRLLLFRCLPPEKLRQWWKKSTVVLQKETTAGGHNEESLVTLTLMSLRSTAELMTGKYQTAFSFARLALEGPLLRAQGTSKSKSSDDDFTKEIERLELELLTRAEKFSKSLDIEESSLDWQERIQTIESMMKVYSSTAQQQALSLMLLGTQLELLIICVSSVLLNKAPAASPHLDKMDELLSQARSINTNSDANANNEYIVVCKVIRHFALMKDSSEWKEGKVEEFACESNRRNGAGELLTLFLDEADEHALQFLPPE
eukprot:TRINITY_DN421_c1_g1_i2.p1 TRINITY_DN421_c1_g1~~TRINITY_DN421_c1_g1_i2.p1  ORF type:complete len:852 (-),score=222.27 TRINITY_DN421_c1_g1_i2:1552-4074(-)